MSHVSNVTVHRSFGVSRLPHPGIRFLCTWGLVLVLLSASAHAAQVVLTRQDPNNSSAEVGSYNIYYWQSTGEAPKSVNTGKQTTYTVTGLEAGKTYSFAITAQDVNGGRESAYSNVVNKTFPGVDTMPPAAPAQLRLESSPSN